RDGAAPVPRDASGPPRAAPRAGRHPGAPPEPAPRPVGTGAVDRRLRVPRPRPPPGAVRPRVMRTAGQAVSSVAVSRKPFVVTGFLDTARQLGVQSAVCHCTRV